MPSMSREFIDVAQFHEDILNDPAEQSPSLISQQYCEERATFMLEEIDEFMQATRSGNIVGVADALADVVYVAIGTAYKMGLPWSAIWEAVHSANMRKVSGQTKRGNAVDAMKPVGWVGPESEIARAIGRALDHAPKS